MAVVAGGLHPSTLRRLTGVELGGRVGTDRSEGAGVARQRVCQHAAAHAVDVPGPADTVGIGDDELCAVGQFIPAVSSLGLLSAAETTAHHHDEWCGRGQANGDVKAIRPGESTEVDRVQRRALDSALRCSRSRHGAAGKHDAHTEQRGESGGHGSTVWLTGGECRTGETEFTSFSVSAACLRQDSKHLMMSSTTAASTHPRRMSTT